MIQAPSRDKRTEPWEDSGLQQPDEIEVDVVVVGSGAAGLAAAIVAAHAGLDVLVIEKTQWFGGSTAVSGGAVWIPDNHLMGDVGQTDSRESVMRYLQGTLGNHLRADMIEAFLDNGPRMLRWMHDNTELRLAARAVTPDYDSEAEGAASGGRALDPVPYDARRLGPLFKRLRPPFRTFMAFGGLMVGRADIDHLLGALRSRQSFAYSMRLLGRYALDRLRHRRGTRLLMGNALAARLLRSAADAGVRLWTDTAAGELLQEHGQVAGLMATRKGQAVRLRARRGVVLATGGFAASSAHRNRLIPHPELHRSMSPDGNTGDGAAMAERVGGALQEGNANHAFWAPVSVRHHKDGTETAFPHLIMDRSKPGLIAVNGTGARFTNEALSYHDFVEAMHRANERAPSLPSWLICDHRFLRRYGMGMARPGLRPHGRLIREGYLKRARTLAGLAAAIGVPTAALEDTVRRVNGFAITGVDADFGKGSTAYNRYLGDAAHGPNPCLGPIEHAPFYAVAVWPGDIGSATGLRTDAAARVLDAASHPIPGLYACGNDMNSVMAGLYPAAGITLGPALTFGFIAGEALAADAPVVTQQAA